MSLDADQVDGPRLLGISESGGAPVAPTREALTEIITGLAGHGYNAQMSQNLGFYRTAVVCSCGVELWWGEHEGDPTHREVWGGHLADSLLASGLLGERREHVQAEALEAFRATVPADVQDWVDSYLASELRKAAQS